MSVFLALDYLPKSGYSRIFRRRVKFTSSPMIFQITVSLSYRHLDMLIFGYMKCATQMNFPITLLHLSVYSDRELLHTYSTVLS